MKALYLCDNLQQAGRAWRGLGDLAGIDLGFVVCNNAHRWPPLFLALLLFRLLFSPRADGRLLRRFFDGRLHLFSRDVNHPTVVSYLASLHADVGLHGMGVIYRRPVIEAFRLGILNAHIGRLPFYRGRSVMEWSIIQGEPVGVTTFFIDDGIDTGGPIIRWEPVNISGKCTVSDAKAYLFDQDLHQYRAALQSLQQDPASGSDNTIILGRRYYRMSALLLSVVENRLRELADAWREQKLSKSG